MGGSDADFPRIGPGDVGRVGEGAVWRGGLRGCAGAGAGFGCAAVSVRRRGLRRRRRRGLRRSLGGLLGVFTRAVEDRAPLGFDRARQARGLGRRDRTDARGFVGGRGEEPLALRGDLAAHALLIALRVVADALGVDLGGADHALRLE